MSSRQSPDAYRKFAIDASQIGLSDVEELRSQGLSDAGIFDVAATAARRAFFTKVLDALGVQSEGGSSR